MSHWTRVIGVAAVCLVCFSHVGADQEGGTPPSPTEVLERADLLFEEEDYSEAIHLYREVDGATGGTSYEALMGLARSHYQLGRMGEAARYAFDAMELGGSKENRAEACMLIGHTYLDPVAFEDQVPGTEMLVAQREANLEKAAGFFRQALQYASEASPDAWIHLAQAFELGGESEAAATLYEAYLEHEPDGEHADEARQRLEELEGSSD